MRKLILNTVTLLLPTILFADQPKDWQLGFQKAASKSMEDIVWFHDYMLLPIIIGITAFVLFLVIYACIRFRAQNNPVASNFFSSDSDIQDPKQICHIKV